MMKPLNELFDVNYGSKLDLNKLTEVPLGQGGVSFVGRSSQNNGVTAHVKILEGIPPYEAGLITVALGGTKLLSSFVQDGSFYTAQNVAILRPKIDMTFQEKVYFCLAIAHNRFRYSAFGREANRTLRTLLVPETSEFPKWVKNFDIGGYGNINKANIEHQIPDLNTAQWGEFRYDELFDIERGRGPRRKDLDGSGTTPFITSSDSNNGLSGFTNNAPIHPGNSIGVNRNGSVAEAFYQPSPFCSTEDVHIFKPKFNLNPYVGLFLTTLIRKEKYRFSYGRKWGIERMNKSIIKLPIDKAGKPDWDFMETFIRSLPYSSQI